MTALPRSAWVVPAIALAALGLLVLTGTNRSAFLALNGLSRLTGPTPWPWVTILGDTAVALALFLPFTLSRRELVWPLLLAALVTTLCVHGVKPFGQVPRPPAVLDPGSFVVIGPARRANAFPSGHTATIFLAAALVWLHIGSHAVRACVLAIAVLVGLSRIVVGVHWPLDVAGGAAIGWLGAMAGTVLARRLPFTRSRGSDVPLVLVCAGTAAALLAGLDTGYPQAAPLQRAIGAGALGTCAVHLLRRLGRATGG